MDLPTRLSFQRRTIGLLALAAGLLPSLAFATLGGTETSIETDRVAMSATAGANNAGVGYTVRSFTLPSTTVVREYLSSSTGLVFGVAWEGPAMPDLKQLLGEKHFDSIDSSARSRNREGRRGPMELRPTGDSSGLVFDSTGHMRAFAGRAYLTPQLPNGVDTDAIR
ncbi:DUF2844 domain-containing protein [Xylophilus sp. GOD-11R]|uniref:DUF2844 domain-containing protein n=1 Tax=Xylophilus sp. GOD-11R TaxID=3089814 RepID=UPI00298CAB41|nr:DUF2844 domain-containing protein [Xylophilus sp. GOD-11R]WPB56129.1 DUF2844 domain-containing protein [Xylophilus sp. GOD-11R]